MSNEKPQAHHANVRVVDGMEPPGAPARPEALPRAAESRSDEFSLASRLWTLYEGRWFVAGVFAATLLAAVAYLVLATPIFRSFATVQVEGRTKTLAGLEELSALFAEHSPAETEIEVITSRLLLGIVVDELKLDLDVHPRRFPLIGRAIASRHRDAVPARAPLGLSSFAWGGERLKVDRLDASEDLLDERLVLTAGEGGRYRIEEASGLKVEGTVGTPASARAGSRHLELFVSELVARPGTTFVIRKLRRDDSIDELQRELKVSEKGKKTGILVMTLDGADARQTSAILAAVSNAYLRQNVERKSAEAAKTLEFIEQQLPVVKANLDAAQSALNTFQVSKGVVDLTSSTTSLLNRSVEVDRALQEMELQRAELHQRFTSNHPSLTSLNEKVSQLRGEKAGIAARLREVPSTEIDSARLLRDVKSSSELYTLLLNKAQELRVVKSGTIGNVRILDLPFVAHKPERPKPPLVLGLAVLLGLAGGVTTVFVRKSLDQGAKDAEEIEDGLGLPVYATIPHSDKVAATSAPGPEAKAAPLSILAATDPGDGAVEHIRSLRTSLRFALVESRNNVVAISGPGPGVGKSFVCVNLAYVLASAERRVLLIDCDLRRGRIHRYFELHRQPGVSDVISGAIPPTMAVCTTSNPHLDVLTTGRIPPNPAELLASQAFDEIVLWASRTYGFVLIDTPPVLAVTDPALVARLAGVNLLVLRAGAHSLREIALAVKQLAQGGVKVQGAVLNDVHAIRGRYGRFGRYQRYEYKASDPDWRKS